MSLRGRRLAPPITVDGPQRHTPRRLAMLCRQQQIAPGCHVVPRQARQFRFKRGLIEVGIDQRQILHMALAVPGNERAHQVAHGVQFGK